MRVVLDTNVLLSALLSPHGWQCCAYPMRRNRGQSKQIDSDEPAAILL